MKDEQYPICPRCHGNIPNNDRPGEDPGALSRRDNKTEICSACGTAEAMEDWTKIPYTGVPYWKN
jgi:hypothetical protein